jgi:hypothetical protein
MIDPVDKGRTDTAEYIQGMAKELETLASQADLGFLAYLLAMVEHEAQRLANEQAAASRNR